MTDSPSTLGFAWTRAIKLLPEGSRDSRLCVAHRLRSRRVTRLGHGRGPWALDMLNGLTCDVVAAKRETDAYVWWWRSTPDAQVISVSDRDDVVVPAAGCQGTVGRPCGRTGDLLVRGQLISVGEVRPRESARVRWWLRPGVVRCPR